MYVCLYVVCMYICQSVWGFHFVGHSDGSHIQTHCVEGINTGVFRKFRNSEEYLCAIVCNALCVSTIVTWSTSNVHRTLRETDNYT